MTSWRWLVCRPPAATVPQPETTAFLPYRSALVSVVGRQAGLMLGCAYISTGELRTRTAMSFSVVLESYAGCCLISDRVLMKRVVSLATPSVVSPMRTLMLPGEELAVQWAAVMTYLSPTRVPPQPWFWVFMLLNRRAT